jgi:NAD-dependent oxidoreductase involved in siderophore biosynthesis
MGTTATFLIALTIAAIFLLVCSWGPIVWTKRFKIADPDKRAEIEDSYRKTIAQILGGAAIAL